MILPTPLATLLLTLATSSGLLLSEGLAQPPRAKEDKAKPKANSAERGPGGSGMKGGGRKRSPEGFSDLDGETRQRIRTALQEVMTNPEVITAREELHRCSEAYRTILRKAIANQDPEVGPLLTKIMESRPKGPRAGGAGGAGPGNRGGWMMSVPPEDFAKRGVDQLHGDILKRLPAESKQALIDAHQEAKASPEVQAALHKILAIDDPVKRLPLGRELRNAYQAAIEVAAPGLAKEIRKLDLGGGGGGGFRKGGGSPPAPLKGAKSQ